MPGKEALAVYKQGCRSANSGGSLKEGLGLTVHNFLSTCVSRRENDFNKALP